VIELK